MSITTYGRTIIKAETEQQREQINSPDERKKLIREEIKHRLRPLRCTECDGTFWASPVETEITCEDHV